ncbi:SCP2 sterol-binding domain-containing protein [Paenibacillus sp. P25]|nr:SCP2 sterol-binding domain-containing protein [Paenibacillus sp. P25]
MNIHDELQSLIVRLNRRPDKLRLVQGVFQFDLEGAGDTEVLQVRFQNSQAELLQGAPCPADCRLRMSKQTLHGLLNNRVNAVSAYMSGAIKMEGKMLMAFRLQEALKACFQPP